MLLVVAVILAAAAVITSRKKTDLPPDIIGTRVLPDLQVNDIEKIVVRSADDVATVERVDGKWISRDRFDYPADFNAVRDILLALSELTVGQVLALDDEQRAEMKLIPPAGGGEDNAGTLIELFDKDGPDAMTLLTGESYMRKTQAQFGGVGSYADGRYVSPDMGQSVYAVSDSLNMIRTAPEAWLKKDLFNVSSSDIQKIELTGPDREPVTLVRKGDGSGLELVGIAEDEEPEQSKISGLHNALSQFNMEDVADPAMSDEDLGMVDPVVFTVETTDGANYTLRIGGFIEDGSAWYVRVAAVLQGVPEPVPALKEAGETEEKSEEKKQEEEKQREQKRKKLANQIRELNETIGLWTYLVDDYKITMIALTRDDLAKRKPEPEEEEVKDESEGENSVSVSEEGDENESGH